MKLSTAIGVTQWAGAFGKHRDASEIEATPRPDKAMFQMARAMLPDLLELRESVEKAKTLGLLPADFDPELAPAVSNTVSQINEKAQAVERLSASV